MVIGMILIAFNVYAGYYNSLPKNSDGNTVQSKEPSDDELSTTSQHDDDDGTTTEIDDEKSTECESAGIVPL